jgi:hypothetical protein
MKRDNDIGGCAGIIRYYVCKYLVNVRRKLVKLYTSTKRTFLVMTRLRKTMGKETKLFGNLANYIRVRNTFKIGKTNANLIIFKKTTSKGMFRRDLRAGKSSMNQEVSFQRTTASL